MFTISVRLDEKRSTTSQYENKTVGVLLEAQNLELHTRDDILTKTRDLFALAKAAVNQQFHQKDEVLAGGNGRDAPPGNGSDTRTDWNNGSSGQNGNGRRRTYGRPDPEPTPKQKQLLARISRDRHLGPEQLGEICSRLIGNPPSVQAIDVKTTLGDPARYRLISLPHHLAWRTADIVRRSAEVRHDPGVK